MQGPDGIFGEPRWRCCCLRSSMLDCRWWPLPAPAAASARACVTPQMLGNGGCMTRAGCFSLSCLLAVWAAQHPGAAAQLPSGRQPAGIHHSGPTVSDTSIGPPCCRCAAAAAVLCCAVLLSPPSAIVKTHPATVLPSAGLPVARGGRAHSSALLPLFPLACLHACCAAIGHMLYHH